MSKIPINFSGLSKSDSDALLAAGMPPEGAPDSTRMLTSDAAISGAYEMLATVGQVTRYTLDFVSFGDRGTAGFAGGLTREDLPGGVSDNAGPGFGFGFYNLRAADGDSNGYIVTRTPSPIFAPASAVWWRTAKLNPAALIAYFGAEDYADLRASDAKSGSAITAGRVFAAKAMAEHHAATLAQPISPPGWQVNTFNPPKKPPWDDYYNGFSRASLESGLSYANSAGPGLSAAVNAALLHIQSQTTPRDEGTLWGWVVRPKKGGAATPQITGCSWWDADRLLIECAAVWLHTALKLIPPGEHHPHAALSARSLIASCLAPHRQFLTATQRLPPREPSPPPPPGSGNRRTPPDPTADPESTDPNPPTGPGGPSIPGLSPSIPGLPPGTQQPVQTPSGAGLPLKTSKKPTRGGILVSWSRGVRSGGYWVGPSGIHIAGAVWCSAPPADSADFDGWFAWMVDCNPRRAFMVLWVLGLRPLPW